MLRPHRQGGTPTIGAHKDKLPIKLANRPEPAHIRGPISLGLALFNIMFSAMDRRYVEQTEWDRTIPIPTVGVGTTDFDLTPRKKEALYKSGYDAAKRFFEEWWDWDRHVKARRKRLTMDQV